MTSPNKTPKLSPKTKNDFLALAMDAMEIRIVEEFERPVLAIQQHWDYGYNLQRKYKNLTFLDDLVETLISEFGFIKFIC